ncbi:MAG: FecR domain-containing protein [Ekhidna sp.]|nr:FecR domain-containing protein [Ekhidna sp.]
MNNELITKYLSNECSDSELEEVQSWIAESADHAKAVKNLQDLWEASGTSESISTDTKSAWGKLSNSLKQKKAASFQPERKKESNWLKYAATILPLIIGAFMLFYSKGPKTISLTNDGIEPMQVWLPDSSLIWLRTNASFEYPEVFADNERRVKLQGEGYFDIQPDKKNPFIVQSGETEIRVLGTEFNLKVMSGRSEVAVYEGSVLFYESQNIDNSETLRVNQKASYSSSSQEFQKQENISINEIAWKTGILSFEEDSYSTVFDELEKYYSQKIEIKDDLTDCYITTVFDNIQLEDCFEIIRAVNDLTIEKVSSGYRVSGSCD